MAEDVRDAGWQNVGREDSLKAPTPDEIARIVRMFSFPDHVPSHFQEWIMKLADKYPRTMPKGDMRAALAAGYPIILNDGSTIVWRTAAGAEIAKLTGSGDNITLTVGAKVFTLGDANAPSDLTAGVEDWLGLPFTAGGWSDLDASHLCQYRKDPFGVVQLRGFAYPLIAYAYGGANATIGTLPAGYRPTFNAHFVTQRTNAGGWLPGSYYINSSGQIVVFSGLGSADAGAIGNVWGLYGARFYVD